MKNEKLQFKNKNFKIGSGIIIALDTSDLNNAKRLVKALLPRVKFFKIGLELINTGKAPELIKFIHGLGGKVFYDVKLNDIPNTVGGAVKVISKLEVAMISVHASMGRESLRVAVKNKEKSKIIGVTVLTSLKDKECRNIFGENSKNKVLNFADMLIAEKCYGIVCSANESKLLRRFKRFNNLIIITPGIRPVWAALNDQTRAITPKKAIDAGADYLVIGRPITAPPRKIGSSRDALNLIIKEI